MSKFIEITDIHSTTLSINVDYIFAVEDMTDSKDKANTMIKIAVMGFNNYPFNLVKTEMLYRDVMSMVNGC